MRDLLRTWCHRVVIRPLMRGACGLRVSHGERLPRTGPAILVANHNSHFDTLALFALFSPREAATLRAVVARDYFRVGSLIGWIARRIFGAITADRAWRPAAGDPLAGCSRVLDAGEILILYPEGTRGMPGVMSELKAGVAYLARRYPKVPVVPVTLSGVERILPKGAVVPLPLTVAAHVGVPRYWSGGDCRDFMAELRVAFAGASEA
ncbi:MAG TPA: lysophospholipid acyltransferase family protein [Stellaceae bacterium]|nr:lysophospholipid acyltransferase family protein [Stellaceae bacterium]